MFSAVPWMCLRHRHRRLASGGVPENLHPRRLPAPPRRDLRWRLGRLWRPCLGGV